MYKRQVQAQTVDNVGAVVGESAPILIHVGETEEIAVEPGELAMPGFDPLTGRYMFSGTAAPGQTVTISSNGTVVGTGLADETGAWAIAVQSDAIGGEVTMQSTNAAGDVVGQSLPLKLNGRPPSLNVTGDVQVDPSGGALLWPARPEGVALSGRGEPGTAVEIVVDGAPATTAVVDPSGQWTATLTLPEGVHVLQLNTLDPGGALLLAALPVTVAVGEAALAEGTPGATEAAPADGGQTVAELLAGRPEFAAFWAAAQATGLSETLAEATEFTVFAPTDDAFNELPPQVIDGLTANPDVLAQLLQYHVARGQYAAADLLVVQPATLDGRLLTIAAENDTLTVNDALVSAPDIAATNGVIHAIDRILVPPLAVGVRPPVIDESGVPTFTGPLLTIVGTAEPNHTILIELNGESFGQPAVVGPDTTWLVAGDVTTGEYRIIAYMLSASGALEAISRPVILPVR